jgi:hypothetical protein
MSASLGVIDRYVITGMLLDSVFNIFLVKFKHISSELSTVQQLCCFVWNEWCYISIMLCTTEFRSFICAKGGL